MAAMAREIQVAGKKLLLVRRDCEPVLTRSLLELEARESDHEGLG